MHGLTSIATAEMVPRVVRRLKAVCIGSVWIDTVFAPSNIDGTGVLADIRPGDGICAAGSAVFASTTAMAGQAGWAYDRVGELPAVRAVNLRWLAAVSLALLTLTGLKVPGVL